MQFKNSMWIHVGQGINARGAVVLRQLHARRSGAAPGASTWGWLSLQGDPRRALVPYLNASYNAGDQGRSYGWNGGPSADFRVSSRVTGSVSYNVGRNVNATQPNGNYGDVGSDTTHYTVARLDQTTKSMTVRLGVTATPNLSLQVYAAPFATRGNFSDWMQVANARAERGAIATRRTAAAIPARSTSSSIARTPSCAGSIVRAPCSTSCGRRSAR